LPPWLGQAGGGRRPSLNETASKKRVVPFSPSNRTQLERRTRRRIFALCVLLGKIAMRTVPSRPRAASRYGSLQCRVCISRGPPCIVEHAGLILEGYEEKSFPGGLTARRSENALAGPDVKLIATGQDLTPAPQQNSYYSITSSARPSNRLVR
jgi:hypothetical protein